MEPAKENTLQRLFSTFAEGWPGFGLLLQRVLTSAVLLYFAGLAPSLPHLMAAVAGVLLLFGLWTPLAGTAIAIVEVWIFLARSGNPLIAIALVTLGATVAMIGPGVWSIDAQLYGRKHIEPSKAIRPIPNPPKV
jgi:putative oxidoreductase